MSVGDFFTTMVPVDGITLIPISNRITATAKPFLHKQFGVMFPPSTFYFFFDVLRVTTTAVAATMMITMIAIIAITQSNIDGAGSLACG